MVYTFPITGKDRETMLHSKTMTQVLLLLLGGAMVLFGVCRGVLFAREPALSHANPLFGVWAGLPRLVLAG